MADNNNSVQFTKVVGFKYLYKPDRDTEYLILTLADGQKVCVSDSNFKIAKEFAKQFKRAVKN